MSTQIQRRRGTTAEHSTFTGVEGEITVDTTKDTAVVHDGTTVGGHPLQKQFPPLGSAAAPTYTFTGDTNTGIYSPGADQVAVATNGVGRLFVASDGKVGIGNANPSEELEITSATPALKISDTDEAGSYGTVSMSSSAMYLQANGAATDGQLIYRSGNAGTFTERLRITSAGLVGIGTSSPSFKLDIFETSATTNSPVIVQNISALSSGTVANGFGPAIRFQGEDASGANRDMAYVSSVYTNASTVDTALTFYTRDNLGSLTERVRIDEQGRLGIGTTSPSNTLQVDADSEYNIFAIQRKTSPTATFSLGINSAQTQTNINYQTDGLVFTRLGSEAMRLDGSRRLLVGTSTARTNLFNSTVAVPLQVEGTGTSSAGISVIANPGATAGNGPAVVLGKSRGSAVGGTTVVASGDELGVLTFQGSDGSEFVEAARISAEVDGTPGANDMPGRLVFFTTADGASSRTERMRITSDAYVRLASGTGGIQFNGDTAAANALDDYEEGTFSPTLSASGATFGYSFSTGRYTKIGNSVTVHGRIILSSASGGSGTVTLTGLPFAGAPAIGGNNIGQQGIIGRSGGFAGDVPDSLEIKEGVTEASIYYRASANAATSLLDYSDLGSTAYFLFTLTYRTTN